MPENQTSFHVLKFGGTSLSSAARINRAVEIVKKRRSEAKVAVVVSAVGGVTDELIALTGLAATGQEEWRDRLEQLKVRHLNLWEELAPDRKPDTIQRLMRKLENRLEEVAKQQKVHPRYKDYILSFGERCSAVLFAATLTQNDLQARPHSSHRLVRTNNRFGDADVDVRTTRQLINDNVSLNGGPLPVITGYIGSTREDEITTLGRSGSDYTAGLVGEALNADEIEIWTDVDGVLTTDPNIANTAVTIPQLNYAEIAEMSHFGTKVLHPRTVLPLEERNIPVTIRNTFNPDGDTTLINEDYQPSQGSLRSVSLKKDIALITIKSNGLDRLYGLTSRALHDLAESDVPVWFNAAASADYGLTFVTDREQKDRAIEVLEETFHTEHAQGLIESPKVYDDVSMVTVIGERLEHDASLSGEVLSVLGENKISPLAIARGSANRHLSLLIPNSDALRAVRLVNDHFCVHARRLRLFIAGNGAIGSKLIDQINELPEDEVELSIIGVCDSVRTAWDAHGIRPDQVDEYLAQGDQTQWSGIIDRIKEEFAYRTVFVDATGSEEVALLYDDLLSSGIHVVTPSKRANSMEQKYFDKLIKHTRHDTAHYYYEANVGAGLPVVQTIRDAIESGDRIDRIEGVVSGTMTYLFGSLENGATFGDTIIRARREGYAEPDPRDDLSGEDVARKFLVLARTSGIKIERADLKVEDLTPEALRDVSLETFMEKIGDYDQQWSDKVKKASERGNVLRYVGELDRDTIRIGVREVPAGSSLGMLKGTDNQLLIYTKRYQTSPIIIQGPGAGREVTAGGVLSDIQKISRRVFS